MNAPEAGTIVEFFAAEEDTVIVGQDLLRLELGGAPPEGSGGSKTAKEGPKGPADPKQEPGGRAKEEHDAGSKSTPQPPPKKAEPKQEPKKQEAPGPSASAPFGQREERRVSTTVMAMTHWGPRGEGRI